MLLGDEGVALTLPLARRLGMPLGRLLVNLLAEVRVPGGRLSAVPVPPTAAEAAAALEPGMDNLTRWPMSITMTPMPKASIGAKGAISSNANPHLPWPSR